jgi:hypothetical protein
MCIAEPDTPLFIFGASYNSIFLWYFLDNLLRLCHQTDPDTTPYMIAGILDNCKEKQGNFLYGTGLKVFSPDVVTHHKRVFICLKNGYYSGEIREQLMDIAKGDVGDVDIVIFE